MGTKYVWRRKDTAPEEEERLFEQIEFADSVNRKYPLDTVPHIRAAWRDINRRGVASKYDKEELEAIKERIRMAAEEHDIEISLG